ncbi:MAG: PQQ-binding-like beta-propeller repeat protein, partial [Anaerolineaceae bacterium]|nr:PQQ-binding-like beta-propeller repeat protein [Anaerolineaceae bacterium]
MKWKRFLGERIEVEMEPLVVGNLVYIGLMNGKMYALDSNSGDTVWVYQAGEGLPSTPTVVSVKDKKIIYFGAMDGKLYALDAETGEELWVFATGGPIYSTPSFSDGKVYIGSLDHNFYAVDASTGEEAWHFTSTGPISTTSALSDPADAEETLIYFMSGDNHAYAVDEDGKKAWDTQLSGVFTKRTYVVYAQGVVIFVTRKPGFEYSEPLENPPSSLQGNRQKDSTVVDAWAKYYLKFPERRPLYYLDAASGKDLWNPSQNRGQYSPLYIPYWGEYLPVVDAEGNAYFPATGSGGDHALDHDMRLWKIDLKTGVYSQVASQTQFAPRFDEVGRPTLVGSRFYQVISEDVGYYDVNTGQLNTGVFGNGFSNHRKPIEFDEMTASRPVFGGMEKFFTRFGGSTPGGFGGANDAASPLVVAGNRAFYVSWGYIYALSPSYYTPKIDYGQLDLSQPPSTPWTRAEVQQQLNAQIEALLEDDEPLSPVSRMWSWTGAGYGSFWHSGEVVRTLAETIPYLDASTADRLSAYLQQYIVSYLLNDDYYQYRWACIDYDTGSIQDPCSEDDGIKEGWFWSSQNLTSERLYGIYKYAQRTGDWELVEENWGFIKNLFVRFRDDWNYDVGFYLFPEWHAGPFNPDLQMGAVLAIKEMSTHMQDAEIKSESSRYLTRMMTRRVYWGKFVRNLYDTEELTRQDYDSWEDRGYNQDASPIPAEGYLDKDNDFRQVYSLNPDEGELNVQFA